MNNKDYNKKTINSYSSGIDDYLKHTPKKLTGKLDLAMKNLANNIGTNYKILEIGAGPYPRDSHYFYDQGIVDITLSDACPEFVKALVDKGENAIEHNILEDELTNNYDLIYSIATIHHFKKEDLPLIFTKIYEALNDKGILFFTLKSKDNYEEEIHNNKINYPRLFAYYNKQYLQEQLIIAGFKKIEFDDFITKSNNTSDEWLIVTAIK